MSAEIIRIAAADETDGEVSSAWSPEATAQLDELLRRHSEHQRKVRDLAAWLGARDADLALVEPDFTFDAVMAAVDRLSAIAAGLRDERMALVVGVNELRRRVDAEQRNSDNEETDDA